MKNSKETRTCIGCRKKDNKHNLIRIAVKDNKYTIDINQKAEGRGTYICKSEDCLNKNLKNKSLKLNIDEEKLNILRGIILGE